MKLYECQQIAPFLGLSASTVGFLMSEMGMIPEKYKKRGIRLIGLYSKKQVDRLKIKMSKIKRKGSDLMKNLIIVFILVFGISSQATATEFLFGRSVDAADFGYNTYNATAAVQDAISSGATTVNITLQEHAWLLEPIVLRDNLTLKLARGVTVIAKDNAYYNNTDSIFGGINLNNVSIIGQQSIIYMNRDDYTSGPPYVPGEWRHAIILLSSSNIEIRDLIIKNTGGDAIFIGSFPTQAPCENVNIRNIIASNNYRTGIGINNVINLNVRDCILSNTNGTSPEAGIDLEIDSPNAYLQNCLIERCEFTDNVSYGAEVHTLLSTENTPDISITFKNCDISTTKSASHGIHIAGPPENGAGGFIKFDNCTIENTTGFGLWIITRYAYNTASLEFKNTLFKNCASDLGFIPLFLQVIEEHDEYADEYGNINFNNVTLFDLRGETRYMFLVSEPTVSLGAANIHGNVNMQGSPIGYMNLGTKSHDIALTGLVQIQ
ncbi:MAG: right-handed parallel beta-helix repeat-containing protein [Colwellia sp.]|nr:right-handed parallel beta-helix repeat-containing protein [Colwellia sp.]